MMTSENDFQIKPAKLRIIYRFRVDLELELEN